MKNKSRSKLFLIVMIAFSGYSFLLNASDKTNKIIKLYSNVLQDQFISEDESNRKIQFIVLNLDENFNYEGCLDEMDIASKVENGLVLKKESDVYNIFSEILNNSTSDKALFSVLSLNNKYIYSYVSPFSLDTHEIQYYILDKNGYHLEKWVYRKLYYFGGDAYIYIKNKIYDVKKTKNEILFENISIYSDASNSEDLVSVVKGGTLFFYKDISYKMSKTNNVYRIEKFRKNDKLYAINCKNNSLKIILPNNKTLLSENKIQYSKYLYDDMNFLANVYGFEVVGSLLLEYLSN